MSPALRLLIYSPPEIAQAEIHDGINVEGEVLIGPRPTSQRAHQSCFNVRVLVQLTVLCQQGHPEVTSRGNNQPVRRLSAQDTVAYRLHD